jgi:anti-sigma-K factor RskA
LVAIDARRPIVAPDDVPLPLLERYAIGQCTPEDLAELEAWIDGQPERRLFLSRFQLLFAEPPDRRAPAAFTEGEIEQAWGRLADRMAAEASKDRVRAAWRRRIATVAIGCVVVALAVWLVLTRR